MNITTTDINDKIEQIRNAILDFRQVFCTEAGKRVLNHIKEISEFEQMHGVQSHEKYAYYQGMRDLYLRIKLNAEIDDKGIDSYLKSLPRMFDQQEYKNNFFKNV